jgi:hypothetical protein
MNEFEKKMQMYKTALRHNPFLGTPEEALERQSHNRLFAAGIVLFGAFVCWFYVFDFGFVDDADIRLAESMVLMIEEDMGLTSSSPEKSHAFVLYQARAAYFLLIELAVFAFAFAVHGKWIFRLPQNAALLRVPVMTVFLLAYVVMAIFFFIYGAAFSCDYRSCHGRRDYLDRFFGEGLLYGVSFILITIGPIALAIVMRRLGLQRTEY